MKDPHILPEKGDFINHTLKCVLPLFLLLQMQQNSWKPVDCEPLTLIPSLFLGLFSDLFYIIIGAMFVT